MTKKNRTKKTIGELTNSRLTWGFNASTRVVESKKGKGSYNRKKLKPTTEKDF